MPDGARVAEYRDTIAEEIFHALGFARRGFARRLLGPLVRGPAGPLGGMIARADEEIKSTGLAGGSRALLADLSINILARGAENIPADGPLLVVSNHPGAYDSLAIMSCVKRLDLKVILSDVALTRAFSAARPNFIFAPLNSAGRTTALRAALGHLEKGGSLLIFPHDEVEPDPDVSQGAAAAIEDWSRSLEIMLRRVPGTRLQVSIASGILMPRFLNSPIVKIRRSAPKRQKLAEVLQIAQQTMFSRSVRPRPRLSFAEPVRGADLPADAIMAAVKSIARRLLEDHLAFFGRFPEWDGAEGSSKT